MDAIVNEHAGGRNRKQAQRLRETLPRLFAQVGLDVQIHWSAPDELSARIERLLDTGVRRLIVGGGDGSLSTAADRLAGTGAVLGVLPLGTFNHFARDLQLPIQLDEAVAVLARGREIVVDVGEVNGRAFVNNASLGVYVRATGFRDAYRSRLGLSKWPAMALAMLRVFWSFPLMALNIDDARGAHAFRTPFVFVGNNAYLREGVAGINRESLSEGMLGIVSSRQIGRFGLVRMGWSIVRGRFDDARMLEQRLTDAARIEVGKRRVWVALDGELVRLSPPLEFRIRAGVLKVVAA
ncbi:MAG TPA: diacylglycerol kinase family protein [Gammaproteobacteria bacterium]|nr:diacylglycerol kinase family protein [Gammaproteobacteria bacterium]